MAIYISRFLDEKKTKNDIKIKNNLEIFLKNDDLKQRKNSAKKIGLNAGLIETKCGALWRDFWEIRGKLTKKQTQLLYFR